MENSETLCERAQRFLPGTTNVWFNGIKVLSQEPSSPVEQTADWFVPRIKRVQNVCTVWENAFIMGADVTLLRKGGSWLKLGSVRASSSCPSPRKSLSRKLTIWPYVPVDPIAWKSESTACDCLLVGCYCKGDVNDSKIYIPNLHTLSTKVLSSGYRCARFTVCNN